MLAPKARVVSEEVPECRSSGPDYLYLSTTPELLGTGRLSHETKDTGCHPEWGKHLCL